MEILFFCPVASQRFRKSVFVILPRSKEGYCKGVGLLELRCEIENPIKAVIKKYMTVLIELMICIKNIFHVIF